MINNRRAKLNNNFTDLYTHYYPNKQCRNVTFIVTHSCNLRCSYCYEHNKSEDKMTFETAKKCVDTLFDEDMAHSEYLNEDVSHGIILDFIGGEPMLEIELIDKIVDYFRARAIQLNHRWATQYMISMSSNGTMYDDPTVQKFINKNKGRVSIGITLDGDKETHDSCRVDCNGCGSYDKAAKAFEDIKEKHGQDGTKFTIAPENVHRTFIACKDMIERFNCHTLHCNCVYEEGWTEALATILYQQLKQLADWIIDTERYTDISLSIFDDYIGQPQGDNDTQNWCGGTGRMLAFDVDGSIYPCLRYAPLSVGTKQLPFTIGSIETGIGHTKEDKAKVAVLNGITRQSQSTKECIDCPISTGCGWCSAYNYEKYGTPNHRATFICPTHKARVMVTSYYLNRIYKLKGDTNRFNLNIPKEWAVPIVGEEEYKMLVDLANI